MPQSISMNWGNKLTKNCNQSTSYAANTDNETHPGGNKKNKKRRLTYRISCENKTDVHEVGEKRKRRVQLTMESSREKEKGERAARAASPSST